MADLYLDSVSAFLKLAISKDGSIIACQAQNQQGSKFLFRELEKLLMQAGITLQDIKAIYFNRGPGSFTGIKVGHVFSQALSVLGEANLGSFTTFDLMAMAVGEDRGAAFLLYAYQNEYFIGRCVDGKFHFDVVSREAAQQIPKAYFWGLDKYCLENFHQISEPPADNLAYLKESGCLSETIEPLYLKKSNAEINLDRALKKSL